MKNKNILKQRLILPISILFGCIVLGGFIYASQISKQKSIEKQQQIDIRAKENQQQLDLQIKKEEVKAKIEADQETETNKLLSKYREECEDIEEKNSKALQTTYDNCESEYCRESIVKFASQYVAKAFLKQT